MLHSWAIYNGVELANNKRVMSYLRNGYGPSSMQVFPDCACQHTDLLGPEEYQGPYEHPVTDSAPWWCPNDPLSDEFAGFYLEKVTGFNSTFSDRAIAQNVGQGGSLGPVRYGPRRLKFTGWLYGRTCAGVEFGLDWLDSVVSGKVCNLGALDVCGLGDLTMAAYCIDNDPDFCSSVDEAELVALAAANGDPTAAYKVGDEIAIQGGAKWRGVARTMCSVGQTQGIKVIQKRGSCCQSCGCTQYRVEFELTSEQPFMYEPPTWCWGRDDGLRFGQTVYPIEFFCCSRQRTRLSRLTSTQLANLIVPPGPLPVDSPRIALCLSNYLPDCGYIDPPEPRPQGDRCFCEPWGTRRRCCTMVNESKVSEEAVVFKLINPSDFPAKNIRISIYEWDGFNWDLNGGWEDLPDTWEPPDCPGCPEEGVDIDGNTYQALTTAWECCSRVATYEITEVPPLSTLEINGACRRISLDYFGLEPRPGGRYVSGDQGTPFKWFDLKPCSRICIVAYADCDSTPNQLRFAAGSQIKHNVSC